MYQEKEAPTVLLNPAMPPDVALYGTCDGCFAFTEVEAAFAQSLLPPDLELAPQIYSPGGKHPLLLMFNKTHLHSNLNLERIAKEYKIGLNLDYNEFIVMLPYVQFKDANYNGDAPYCFLPILYLDSLLAVLGGRIFWEFNKQLARFTTTDLVQSILPELSDKPFFSSALAMGGMAVLDSAVKNFNAITPILNLPVLEYGFYGYVSSIYKVEYERAMIISSSIDVMNQSCPYLPPGSFKVPGILEAELGCFNLQYFWSLTYIKFIKL